MGRKPKIQSPTGMHDILPEEQVFFQKIFNVSQEIARFYGFQKIDTPVLEHIELFIKSIGSATDIVEKEMYVLRTKGGDELALRPEFTPGVARAYIQHGMFNLPQPLKLFSFGPLFRYERPQAGRYRQFHQVNFEIFGERNPVMDAQIIQILYNILKELKIKNIIVHINSIGDSQCRPYYKKILVNFLRSKSSALCADCRRRLKINPLRVLDCKEEKCQRVIMQAPQLIDHLCDECKTHFKKVLEYLDEVEIPYHLNPYLVRGLDYYTKTVFEIFEEGEEQKRQSALGGGGRYDNLIKFLGGKPTPACGGALGVERVVIVLKEKIKKEVSFSQPKIFLAHLGELARKKALKLLEEFRRKKVWVGESLGRDSLKAQLKIADKMGVKYSLILGQKEALEGTIILRDMEKGTQKLIKLEKVVEEVKKKLKKL